jgi:BirA family transcriptional regulator, biotin operon repressor / biotin---[acetyl-CoA-carboxylase] ligase
MWLYYLKSCDSTNTWALNRLDDLPPGAVIFTHQQTAGRGQHGRNWYAPPGTITASFILKQIPNRQLAGKILWV